MPLIFDMNFSHQVLALQGSIKWLHCSGDSVLVLSAGCWTGVVCKCINTRCQSSKLATIEEG